MDITAGAALTASTVVVERLPLALGVGGWWCVWVVFGTGGDRLDDQGLIPFGVLGRLDRVIVLHFGIVDEAIHGVEEGTGTCGPSSRDGSGPHLPRRKGLARRSSCGTVCLATYHPGTRPRAEVLDNPHPPVTELGDLGRWVPRLCHHDEVLDAIVGAQVVVQVQPVEQQTTHLAPSHNLVLFEW